jgi:hypothetical protein
MGIFGAVLGGLLGMNQASKQRKAESRAERKNEEMLAKQLEQLGIGRAEGENILKMLMASSKAQFGQMQQDQQASQEQQRGWMSGGQFAAQQAMTDANKMAMDQITAGSMGTGRFGSVLSAQMRAGMAQQTGKTNTQLAAMFGQQMAGLEAQQQGQRLGLSQASLGAEQAGGMGMLGLVQKHRGGMGAAYGGVQYMAPQAQPNIFASMMGAAGQAGGFGNLFNFGGGGEGQGTAGSYLGQKAAMQFGAKTAMGTFF